jgi:hypothetical protein
MNNEQIANLLKKHASSRVEYLSPSGKQILIIDAEFNPEKNTIVLTGVQPLSKPGRITDKEYNERYNAYEKFWATLRTRGERTLVLAYILQTARATDAQTPEFNIWDHHDDAWDELTFELQKLVMIHIDLTKKLEIAHG